MENPDVISTAYGKTSEMVDEFGTIIDDLKAKDNVSELTTQQYAYCFVVFNQTWFGGVRCPKEEIDLCLDAFEQIVTRYKIYAWQRMFYHMSGWTEYDVLSTSDLMIHLRAIVKSSAQFKLSDSVLGQTVLANHDRDVGLEYERKGATERFLLAKAKSADELPRLD